MRSGIIFLGSAQTQWRASTHIIELTTAMNLNFLDFEQPIAELEGKIEELQLVGHSSDVNIADEIAKLRQKSSKLTETIYSKLTAWDVVKIARHPQRPYTSDYIPRIFTEFEELHGDRHFGDDKAIIGGVARLDGKPVMVIGEEKGRTVTEKVMRNFGMPKPEGYRKALRLMEMAERFKMPVITLIDTPGAYPGIDSEERGISESIAQNLAVMSRLRTPIICTVIGEGSSGGALAIGVGDQLNMLQYSTYFVISPEGCANIIWKTVAKAPEAAQAMGVTSKVLQDLGIVDETIPEPLGGAHRDVDAMSRKLQERLIAQVDKLSKEPLDALLERRYQRLMSYGNP
jgi:acetyl-CoA carboxylase carboxyl transferase subunit alpha